MKFLQAKLRHGESKRILQTYTYFLQAKETHGEFKNEFFKLITISCKQKKHTEHPKTNSSNLHLFLTSQRNTRRIQKQILQTYAYFLQARETHGAFKNKFFKLMPISYKPKKYTENSKTNYLNLYLFLTSQRNTRRIQKLIFQTFTYFLQAKETHGAFKNKFFKFIPISYKPKIHTENPKTNSSNLYLFLTSQRNTRRIRKRILQTYTYFLQATETHWHTDNWIMNSSNIFLYST